MRPYGNPMLRAVAKRSRHRLLNGVDRERHAVRKRARQAARREIQATSQESNSDQVARKVDLAAYEAAKFELPDDSFNCSREHPCIACQDRYEEEYEEDYQRLMRGKEPSMTPEYDDDDFYDCEPEWDDEIHFAHPGGNSALRAATPNNPRDQPCPTCGSANRLTPKDVALGYQCDACADRDEMGF